MVSLMGNLPIDEIPSALSGPLFPYCPYIEEADLGPYHVIEEEEEIMGTHEVEALPSAIDEGAAPGSVPLFGGQYYTIEEEEIMGTHEVEALPSILDPPVPIEIEIVEKGECSSDSDCPSGQMCVFSPGAEAGTCLPTDQKVVIRGVSDEKTCSFCQSQIGRVGTLDSIVLPPYHKYCRCWWEYI
jgi:hypothetical protein